MKQIYKIQTALINKKNIPLLVLIEQDKNKYLSLKKEFFKIKSKNNILNIHNSFIVYLFLISVVHDDLEFAFDLKDEYKIEEMNTKGANIALGRFFYALNHQMKVINYLLPIHHEDNSLEFEDFYKLYSSLLKMAMFKETEELLEFALNKYPDLNLWKFEALKYQISTLHINPKNNDNIISNLNYMLKFVEKTRDYMYMGYSYYNAGYYQQSFNMYDKCLSIMKIDLKKDNTKSNFDAQKTLDSMNEIIDLLADMDIVSFPIAGSLLGLVRDGKLFDHDKDADIGIFMDDYDDIHKLVLALCKIEKFIAPSIVKEPKENAVWNVAIFDTQRNTAVDLFFFHKEKDYVEYGINTKCGTITWLFKPFGLKKETLAGREYYVPEDYKGWLTQMYGKWDETVIVWESLLNCPNLAKKSQIPILYYGFQKLLDAVSKKSLVKFDNMYNSITKDWHFKFSKEADENLVKIRKELSLLEDGTNND